MTTIKIIGLLLTTIGTVSLLFGFFSSAPQWIFQIAQFFQWIANIQEKITLKQARKHVEIKAAYMIALEQPQIALKYWWMEYRLASFRAAGRHSNEIARKNRLTIKLPHFRIIDTDGYLVEELVSENRHQLHRWSEKTSLASEHKQTPRLAYIFMVIGTISTICGSTILAFT